ncbi:MAG: TRAFAC clade GTPase domain-containing protein [Dolichospermum sp.]
MLPTYNVVILGPSGSGKTVFLGSMYHKLSTQGESGFFLAVDDAQRKILNQIYTEVATEETWTKPTQVANISNWKFTCKIQTPKGTYSACQFQYTDYAGEMLTDHKDDTTYIEKFNETIRNADVLLGLIDGSRLLSYMKGEASGKKWVFSDLANVLSLIQDTDKSIHFVISKWDLIEDKYTLEDARNRLLEIEQFRNIIKTRSDNNYMNNENNGNDDKGVIRLIPVSSVGKGFAEHQTDGSMKKTGKLPKPYNIELPIACILPDKLKEELKKIINEQNKKSQERIQDVKPNLSLWDKLKKYFGTAAKTILEKVAPKLPPQFQFSKEILTDIIDFIDQELQASVIDKEIAARERTEQLKAKQKEALVKIESEKTALEYSIRCFLLLVNKLEYEHPYSKLTN